MKRRNFLKTLGKSAALTTVAGASFNCQPKPAHNLPNFVILFADDMGYGDPSCYGHPTIKTPNIDKMAEEGVRFTSFYVPCCVCSPSRAALLTGRHPLRCGVPGVYGPESPGGLPETEITLADALKKKDYKTACIGKWHIGHAKKEYLPNSRGFDYYYGLLYSNDMIRPWVQTHKPLELFRNEESIEHPVKQETLTERYTSEAVEFIKDNAKKPFFLYLPYAMPHLPIRVSSEFKGTSLAGLYGDTIETIDWSVGQVLKTLKDEGLEKNTFVIFTSDNGPWLNLPDRMLAEGVERWHAGSRGPLNGGKATTYEGGTRVPAVFRWPGVIPKKVVTAEPASTLDFFPTICKLAGLAMPTDRTFDGSDIMPLLKGISKSPMEIIFFNRGNFVEAVRQGDWKLRISNKGPDKKAKKVEAELFNLQVDPYEFYNVAERHPEIVESLKKKLSDFAIKVGGDTFI